MSYSIIRNLGILPNKDLDFAKTSTKEIALSPIDTGRKLNVLYTFNLRPVSTGSSYRNYHNNVPQHFFKEEFLALQNLRRNKDIVIKKSDKGNPVVIVDKTEYLDKMESLLNDMCINLKKLI